MAINFDNALSTSNVSSGSINVSYTTGILTNGFMVVFIQTKQGNTSAPTVTYNGVSMTAMSFNPFTIVASNAQLCGYYLANPSSGTNTLAITMPNGNVAAVDIATYSNVLGVDATPTPTKYTSGTSFSSTVTTVADNSLPIIFALNFNGGTLSAGTNVTARSTDNFNTDNGIGDLGSAKTPAGLVTQTFTCSAAATSGNSAVAAQISLAPIVSLATPSFLTLLGVG